MLGIDTSKKIEYIGGSFRYFEPGECYVTRICKDYVLLMVFEGVLRFRENGIDYEIHPGEFRIHWANSYQEGIVPCDSPKYLYVHFSASSADNDDVIPICGNFDYEKCKSAMERVDDAFHNKSLLEKNIAFFALLDLLPRGGNSRLLNPTVADVIADYMRIHYEERITLNDLCEKFNYCKSYISKVFNERFGMSPISYLNNNIRLNRAEYLLVTTSRNMDSIIIDSGFHDYSCFYKAFLKKNKMTPGQWRKSKKIE